MYITIVHDIHDPKQFRSCAEQVFPLPETLTLHQIFPAADLRQAVCLDEALGDSRTQNYFTIAEQQATGFRVPFPPEERGSGWTGITEIDFHPFNHSSTGPSAP